MSFISKKPPKPMKRSGFKPRTTPMSRTRNQRAQEAIELKVRYQRPLKTRRDPDDKKVREEVLERDEYTCQRCGIDYSHDPSQLENSHFFNRRKQSVRRDHRNCCALCAPCHRIWEHQKEREYRAYMIRRWGQEGFDELQRLAEASGLNRVKKAEAKEAFRESVRRVDTGRLKAA